MWKLKDYNNYSCKFINLFQFKYTLINLYAFIYLGYIILRVKRNDKVCENCFLNVCVAKPLSTKYSTFVNFKEYKHGSLHHPSENTFDFFLCLESIFRQNQNEVLNNRIKFMEIIKSAINDFEFSNCHNIKSKFLPRFIEFRCKNLSSYLNKQIKKKKERRSSFKSKQKCSNERSGKNVLIHYFL